jgi:hypothetical protein
VLQIVAEHVAYGWDAAEIHRQHPYLSLGQIHGALTYYHDHKAEMDEALRAEERFVEEMKRKHDDTPVLRDKLRAQGRLP